MRADMSRVIVERPRRGGGDRRGRPLPFDDLPQARGHAPPVIASRVCPGRNEVLFMGLALYTIINEHRSLLEDALARGCHIRFLMFDMFDMNSSGASLLS